MEVVNGLIEVGYLYVITTLHMYYILFACKPLNISTYIYKDKDIYLRKMPVQKCNCHFLHMFKELLLTMTIITLIITDGSV